MNNFKKHIHIPLWLFILLSVVFILRIPSFFEPYNYGDEMIYLTLGEGMRQGKTLYLDVHDNKPPLLYLTAALAGNLFMFKTILLVWHFAAVILFWKLTTNLRPKQTRFQQVATLVFAIFTTIPLFEGNIVNAELFMLAPTIAAFLILLQKRTTIPSLLLAGFLFSIATLFKIPAAFDIPAVLLVLLFTAKLNKKSVGSWIKMSLITGIGFLVPILVTFLYYASKGAFQEYFVAAFMQNVGYLSSWRPDVKQEPFLVKNGPLLIRALIVAIGTLFLFTKRKKLSKTFLLASLWMLFTLFSVTLSERPYPHYLIQVIPSLALLLGLFTSKTMEQVLIIIPISLFLAVPVYYKYWYYPTTPYYIRFVKFATGALSKDTYFRLFDAHAPRNYEIAKLIQSHTTASDSIFVWGNSSTLYALSRRLPPIKYVADYHINDFSNKDEVHSVLSQKLPRIIVVLPDAPDFPELDSLLSDKYLQIKQIEGAVIWNRRGIHAR